jgi:hypothetical protein
MAWREKRWLGIRWVREEMEIQIRVQGRALALIEIRGEYAWDLPSKAMLMGLLYSSEGCAYPVGATMHDLGSGDAGQVAVAVFLKAPVTMVLCAMTLPGQLLHWVV